MIPDLYRDQRAICARSERLTVRDERTFTVGVHATTQGERVVFLNSDPLTFLHGSERGEQQRRPSDGAVFDVRGHERNDVYDG